MRIAIPKGCLQEKALRMFDAAGYPVPDELDLASRRLVFRRGAVEWILVKDCDVPVYVEHGAADAGIAGLDQLLEHDSTAYQPVDMPFGRCTLALITAAGAQGLTSASTATIATKYPRITRSWLEQRGHRAEIIPLGGSVELAAVLGLTSHVVDLVETGETIRTHGLEIEETIAAISPRLIVGKDIYRTNPGGARELIERVRQAVGSEERVCAF
ncbi:MAG TPA: ATP phosphoribosyltransferase [Thermoanaerobaculia bacterium]|nr:ATP phosphoribosyltransferase [Thermoanaerobaculia bacterium]